MRFLKTGLILFSIFLTSCFDAPSFLPVENASSFSSKVGVQVEIEKTVDETGAVSGEFSANSKVTQNLNADPNSALGGSGAAFPPGALQVATTVTLEEGVDLNDFGIENSLGLAEDTEIASSGVPVVISSSVATETKEPFTLALPIPSDSNLLQGDKFYSILFRVEVVSESVTKEGLLPTAEIIIENGIAKFQTKYFGAYQVVTVTKPIEQKIEKVTEKVIVSKTQAQLAPMELSEIDKIAAPQNGVVTMTGANLRKSMTVAFSGGAVAEPSIVNESTATFSMPETAFGFNEVTVTQDGTVKKFTLFALNDKVDYPLITMDSSGVCEGVTYYDASGNLKTGTKKCATTTTSTGSNLDADANGAADRADSATTATTASYATQAGYAQGKSGTDIVAASTISIPTTGDFFRVIGGGTINDIATTGNYGRRAILYFDAPTTLAHSNTIDLYKSTDYKVIAGDIIELMEVPSGWMELMRKSKNKTNFYARMDNTGVTTAEDYYSDFITWSEVVNDNLSNYDPTTKEFTITETGTYTVEYQYYAELSQVPAKFDSGFQILRNGNFNTTGDFTYYCGYSGTTVDCGGPKVFTYGFVAGDVLTFKVYFYDKDAQVDSVTFFSNNMYIKIVKND